MSETDQPNGERTCRVFVVRDSSRVHIDAAVARLAGRDGVQPEDLTVIIRRFSGAEPQSEADPTPNARDHRGAR